MNLELIKNSYNGRMLDYSLSGDVLILWVSGDPVVSFEVKMLGNSPHAYAFEGDLTIEEIKEGIRIFQVIHNLQEN